MSHAWSASFLLRGFKPWTAIKLRGNVSHVQVNQAVGFCFCLLGLRLAVK